MIVQDYQSEAKTLTISSGSTQSPALVRDEELDRANWFTVYTPTLTSTSITVECMATSGSGWFTLHHTEHDESNSGSPTAGGVPVTFAPNTAREFRSPAFYAMRVVAASAEAAERQIVVRGEFNVTVRSLA